MAQPRHVFETYIKASQDRIWQALIDPELTSRYFFDARVASTWDVGAPYRYDDRRTRRRGRGRGHRGRSAEAARDVVSRAVRRRHRSRAGVAGDVGDHAAGIGVPCHVRSHRPLRCSQDVGCDCGRLERGAQLDEDVARDGRRRSARSPTTVGRRSVRRLLLTSSGTARSASSATTAPTTCSSGRIAPTAETQTMIDMAHAAKYHWGKVGTPVNQVRGDYLCSRVYAFVGRAEPALHHARRRGRRSGSPRPRGLRPRVRPRGDCTRARVRRRRRGRQTASSTWLRAIPIVDRGGPRDLRRRPREGAVVRRARRLSGREAQKRRCTLARSAPARSARSFSHTTEGATSPMPAEVSNPQSVAGDDAVRVADGRRDALDAVGDDLRVLDVVARRVDHAGDERPCRRAAAVGRSTRARGRAGRWPSRARARRRAPRRAAAGCRRAATSSVCGPS